MTYVTAMYYAPPNEKIGGRGYSFKHYEAPFYNIVVQDKPIIIYTHERLDYINEINSFFKKYNFKKYKIIERELEDYEYNEKIMTLKSNDNLNDRNYHICLQKLRWLNEQAESNPFNSKKFFWIDAGLYHHGLFPDSLGGMERFTNINKSRFYPKSNTTLFTPALSENIFKQTGDKLFCIKHTEMPVNNQIYKLSNLENYTVNYIVGGLFGGTKNVINFLNTEFDKYLKLCLDNGMLHLEEPILSVLSSLYKDKFNCKTFNKWHHDMPNPEIDSFHGSERSSFSKEDVCFYSIFLKL